MNAPLGTVIIYARDMVKSATFYRDLFGFRTSGAVIEGLIELTGCERGAGILVHQAAKSVKLGQVGVKLSFHVADVEAFKEYAVTLGVKFGPTHTASGYTFVNVKDPDRNSVSISSRAYHVSKASAD